MRKQVLAVTIGVLLVLSVFSVLQVWQIKPAEATTTIFSSDFEGTDAEWTSTAVNNGVVDLNGPNNPYAGSECGEFNISSPGGSYAYAYKNFSGTYANVTATVFMRVNNTNTVWAYPLRLYNLAASQYVASVGQADGTWRIHYYNATDQIYVQGTKSISVNTWYNVTLYALIDGSAGIFKLYVDNTLVCDNSTLINNGQGNIGGIRVGHIYNDGENFNAKIDNVLVTTGTDSPATSYTLTINSTPASVGYTINDSSVAGYSVTAVTGSATDIQIAVDAVAAYGDGKGTVIIPDGTWNFSDTGDPWSTGYSWAPNARVKIPAGINIIAQTAPTMDTGANSSFPLTCHTILQLGYDVASGPITTATKTWFEFDGTGIENKSSRFSGIMLKGYRSFYNQSKYILRAISFMKVLDFRVDYCIIENVALGILADGGTTAKCRGVVDHNKLYNTIGYVDWGTYDNLTIGYAVQPIMFNAPSSVWNTNNTAVFGAYTNYSIYIENNYFSRWRHCVSSGSGANTVFRFNIINNDYGSGSVDVHGQPLSYIGGRNLEIYNNTFQNCNISQGGWDFGGNWHATQGNPVNTQAILLRGGSGAIFNNSFDGTYVYSVTLTPDDPANYPSPNPGGKAHDLFIYSNINLPTISTSSYVVLETDYFLHAPNASQFVYTPYAYPHELTVSTSGSTNSSITLDEGTYLVTVPAEVTSGDYNYEFSQWQDTSTNLTYTVTLSGNTTITATYTDETPVIVTLTYPENATYAETTIIIAFTASGGVIDHMYFNCKNATTWIYATNRSYPEFESLSGFINGTQYTLYAFANNTDGIEGYATVMFSVQVPAYPTVNLVINTWWGVWW